MNRKFSTSYFKGFTLVELLVALMVMGIVLAAAASLAYAMSSANDSGSDKAEKQAQLRYATMKISELIRNCKLITDIQSDNIEIWAADDDDDNTVDASELVYIDKGNNSDYIRLRTGATETELISNCSNVTFSVHGISPPQTRRVTLFFDLAEDGTVHNYQISATLRGWAGHLLDESGTIIEDDD